MAFALVGDLAAISLRKPTPAIAALAERTL
jgi:hypothetical protein